jgi:hypothetical protein
LIDLLQLRQTGTIAGLDRVVEIGAQQLSSAFLRSRRILRQLYEASGRPYTELGTSEFVGTAGGEATRLSAALAYLPTTAPPSRLFWESLGFKYAAVDFGGHRDSIPLDLNRDEVPDELRGSFQLAINAGTTEHVANQDNAFRVIHDLVCRGGIMMHEVPAQGMMNHGLINYNPKFFWHLCRENGYEVLSMIVTGWTATPVPENVLDSNRVYGHPAKIADDGVYFINSKIAESVPDFMIRATLRKLDDRPFVTPLDLPTD